MPLLLKGFDTFSNDFILNYFISKTQLRSKRGQKSVIRTYDGKKTFNNCKKISKINYSTLQIEMAEIIYLGTMFQV